MALVEVKIGARTYSLACEDGQEESLQATAAEIDGRVSDLSKKLRTSNEPLLLLLTSLTLQDEFNDYKAKTPSPKLEQSKDDEMAEVLNTVSGYLENIIKKVEK